MIIVSIILLSVGTGFLILGILVLLWKEVSKDTAVIRCTNPVIKIPKSRHSDSEISTVISSSQNDILIIGEIFNSLEDSIEDLGEIDLMTQISQLFRSGQIKPETVILAEERINMYISEEVWEMNGGRAAARERDRDAILSSMSYREFIGTLKKIIRSKCSSEKERFKDVDLPMICPDEEIVDIPLEDFEIEPNEEFH